MVTAKLIDRDGKFYIYEYRPEDGDAIGQFATTDDFKEIYILSSPSFDTVNYYMTKALNAIKTLKDETGEMPPKIVLTWN